MCGVKFAVVLLVLCAGGGSCSFLLNATILAAAPPLNRLDSWDLCKGEDDVYCIVDAALASNASSALLEILKEHSAQEAKHFNRTKVHRGLCVSRCGPREDAAQPWRSAAAACLTEEMAAYGLEAAEVSVRACERPARARELTASARAFAVFAVVLCAVVLLATAVHVLGEKFSNSEGNKYLLAFSLKRNWAILTYDRSKPRSDMRMKELSCMEAIRSLSMMWVVFTHLPFINTLMFQSNPEVLEKALDSFSFALLSNAGIWLQMFFAMSGFLTAYTVLITADKSPITLWKCFIGVINRIIRLGPASYVGLWFVMTWLPLLGSGPQWMLVATREAHDCENRLWYHLFFVQNFMTPGEMCMPPTWYIAADLQLHVVGLLALWVMMRWRAATVPVLVLMAAVAPVASGLVAYYYGLGPLSAGNTVEAMRSLLATNAGGVQLFHLPPWMNAAGYTGGVVTAFVYHHVQVEGIKLNHKKWFKLLFHLAPLLALCLQASFVPFASDAPPPAWARVAYSVLERPLAALIFNIILLGYLTKCDSSLRRVFKWRGFHFMGRLSYCVFLLHMVVITLWLPTTKELLHTGGADIVNRTISAVVISFLVAIPFCLLFELPPIQLWKAIVEGDRRVRALEVTSPPVEDVKPLDLVANIARRPEV